MQIMRVGSLEWTRWVLDTGSVFVFKSNFTFPTGAVHISDHLIYVGTAVLSVVSCTTCDLTPCLNYMRDWCQVPQLALDPAVYAELKFYKWTSVSPHAIKGLDDLYDKLY